MVQNPTPNVANQWSPLLHSGTPSAQAGGYTQDWTDKTQPQFALDGPTSNTQTKSSTFTDLSFSSTTVTPGSNFDSGTLTLTEDGSSTAAFTGKFPIVSGISGVSFNFKFTNASAGDQLVICVNTGFFRAYQLHYVMTDAVAGKGQQFGTLSLGSLAHSFFDAKVQIQLVPAKNSTGETVTVTNMQQFTTPS